MSEYILDVKSQTSKVDWAFPFQRTGPFPIDRSSVFSSLSDAEKYANGLDDERKLGGTSYIGQIVSVYEAGETPTVSAYIIGPTRTLLKLAATTATGDISQDIIRLEELISGKASTEYVNKKLDEKANANAVYTKSEIESYVAQQIANIDHLKRVIMNELPDISQANSSTIYMIKKSGGGIASWGKNIYEEYMAIDNEWELLGNSQVDLTDYAKTEDIPDNIVTCDLEGATEDETVIPDFNSNINPVEKTDDMTQPVGVDASGKLWVAPISGGSGGNVDLSGYATEKWVQEGYQPKGEYLTEHQDISGKLDASKLPEAVNDALAQAKASGEFDGQNGKDYVLTEVDKTEIAEQAAQIVEDQIDDTGDLVIIATTDDTGAVIIDHWLDDVWQAVGENRRSRMLVKSVEFPNGEHFYDVWFDALDPMNGRYGTYRMKSGIMYEYKISISPREFNRIEVTYSEAAGPTGEVGFSPTVTVTEIDDGAVISITDKNGTTTATVNNGNDYVLTEVDKTEIAELAAELVEVPDGVDAGIHIGPNSPEDTSLLWIDTSDNSDDDAPGGGNVDLTGYAKIEDIPTDDHINNLINTALGVIENGTY